MQETHILDTINSLEDFKNLKPSALVPLAAEIREFLLDTVSQTGGHLASNLGVVELTMAVHRVFSSPQDQIIFDVGHQSYVHKILTGRRSEMETLRNQNGLSGFPKRTESVHDAFNTGHAGTSISAALGMARAKALTGQPGHTVAIIGDGALGNGLPFEALNDAGQSKTPIIVVLNDNGMSISRNVGAINGHLNKIRSSKNYLALKRSTKSILERIPVVGKWLHRKIDRLKNRIKYFILPNVLFENLGFTYLGPVNGHHIRKLAEVLNSAKELNKPVLVHAITQKGRGYHPAESMPERFHGIGAFDIETGNLKHEACVCNSSVFGSALMELAYNDPLICAITAGMPQGTGLDGFKAAFRNRFFDVGIAEEHAVTMAGGMAANGLKPVVAIYSTFLQRAYDEILHDICLQDLPVTFAIDRAGLVGEDGETHQGVFDISFLMSLPNMQIYAPSTHAELRAALKQAIASAHPAAVRYNRGCLPQGEYRAFLDRWEVQLPISDVTVIAAGRFVSIAYSLCKELGAGCINATRLKPLDERTLNLILDSGCKRILTIEDGVVDGGFGMYVANYFSGTDVRVKALGVPSCPIAHAKIEQQDEECRLLPKDIRDAILALRGLEA